MIRIAAALLLASLSLPTAATAASLPFLAVAPDDPRAVTVHAKGDGSADDAAAIQRALDEAAAKPGGGLVFLPSGRYRIGRTLFVWPGVRLYGVGRSRPLILLGDNTPGFQRGIANMVIFAGAKPGASAARREVAFPPPGSVPFNKDVPDANPGTFYSALSNVDFRIGSGNAGATAIRFHAAQHAFLSHIDFDIGSGLAGLYHVANAAEDLHFHGGRYGILAEKPSPAWGFALVDSTFDGQREAAIREHEAGLTMLNVSIRNTPVGIDIDRGYGDWLFGKGVRFENVARAGVVISNEGNVFTQIGFEDASAADTPTFAQFRDSGKSVAGKGRFYRVSSFSYGLSLPGPGQMGEYRTQVKAEKLAALPPLPAPVLRALPPVVEWANVRALGARGDNKSDDTAAIQRAIDAHRTVYFPAGFYLVRDTLRLRPDSVLIGLHPSLTQIVLPDRTEGFQAVGAPKALMQSANGGEAVVVGLGLNTGGVNARATALLWQAGARSQVSDVKFEGGHGTDLFDGTRFNPYNANGTGDPDPARRWDAQYASLWVTNGGGGTFFNLWSPDTYANPGIYVSDTQTPGRIIQASVEHHVRTEYGFNRVANWELYTPQTEQEAGEGTNTVSLEIRDSHDMLVANWHAYRVTRTRGPAPAAAMLYNVRDIRFRNVHVNGESGVGTCDENGCTTFLRLTKFPFENAIVDNTSGVQVREREFATLDIGGGKVRPPATSTFNGAKVEALATGFQALGGGAVDAGGTLYFVDRKAQRILSWADGRGIGIVRDAALDPVNLAVDRSGNLIVLSSDGRNGTVYSFRPDSPDAALTILTPRPIAAGADTSMALPVNWWINGEFKDQLDPVSYRFTTLAEMFARDVAVPKAAAYVSPDGSLALPAFRTIQQGPPDYRGLRFSDALDSYGFVTGKVGEHVFVTNASENKTYSGVVGAGGAISGLKPFADRGGEGVTVDTHGRVYVANGQVFVYAPDGREIGRIDVPERPLQLIVGGKDRRRLYIIAHHALYAADLP